MSGGNAMYFSQSQFKKWSSRDVGLLAVNFICYEQCGLLLCPQILCNLLISCCKPRAAVHQKDNQVRLRNRLAGLLRHCGVDAFVLTAQTTSVNNDEFALTKLHITVFSIASEASKIRD